MMQVKALTVVIHEGVGYMPGSILTIDVDETARRGIAAGIWISVKSEDVVPPIAGAPGESLNASGDDIE